MQRSEWKHVPSMELINESSYDCVKHTQYLELYNKYAAYTRKLNDKQRDIWREGHLIFMNGLLKAAKENPGKSILHLYDDPYNCPGHFFDPNHQINTMIDSLIDFLLKTDMVENK